MEEYGIEGIPFGRAFLLRTIENVALAVEKAKMNAQIVTQLGFGEAKVEKVASNRRILGKDGNDGSHEVRPILANRMEADMIKAWQATKKIPV